MELRPYQQELVDALRVDIASGYRSICAVLGCGGGKSVIEGMIAESANRKGNRVLFLVHRQELCEQIRNTFTACGVDWALTAVCMVQTATRHLERLQEPKLIITDECHHVAAESYQRIYRAFPDAVKLGFTATPVRLNEGGMGKYFDKLEPSVSTKWLIENHYLAPYRYYSIKLADASGLHMRQGDYKQDEVNALMEKSVIYGKTVETYREKADGTQAIVYCASVKASESTAEAFSAAGIAAVHLDGETPKEARKSAVDAFRRGEVKVLSNVDLFGEGFDVPDCETVILLRPTASLTVHIQQSMRSMRYKPDKTALIIDHVANYTRHGFPDDLREWTLEGRKRKNPSVYPAKQCPVCYRVVPSAVSECPDCGYQWEIQEREDPETVNVELSEIHPEDFYKVMPYSYTKQIQTWDELVQFQKAKGYKFGWCLHQAKEKGIPIPSKYTWMVRNFT